VDADLALDADDPKLALVSLLVQLEAKKKARPAMVYFFEDPTAILHCYRLTSIEIVYR
jgi:hypothetical protein